MQKHDNGGDGEDPMLKDVPLDDENIEESGLDVNPKTNCDIINCKIEHETRNSNNFNCCCTSKTLCTLLTFLMVVLTCTGIGFAIFPATRRLSLVVILPLFSAAFISCLIACCCCSNGTHTTTCDNDNLAVVEIGHTHLPCSPAPKKNKSGFCCDSKESTSVSSTSSLNLEGEEANGKNTFLSMSLPDFSNILKNTRASFDESRKNFDGRFFKQQQSATTNTSSTLCKLSPPIPCNSTASLSTESLSHRYNTDTDIECCDNEDDDDDVYCLRDEYGAINLTGTYKLVHNQNFDGFLKILQIPALFRKAANATRPIHKYTHKGDTFRVQIDGIVKGDSNFVINGPPSASSLRIIKFEDHVSYLKDKRGIVVRKIVQNEQKKSSLTASEITVTRELSKNGQQMILTSRALHSDGSEIAVSVQTFNRVQ